MVCVVWRLIFLYFHNSSKIEKDDKSPGEESDISDDDTGLLFYYLFFHLECTLNPSIRVRELFNDFGYSKCNWRTSGPLQPITTRLKNWVSQSGFVAKPQSMQSAGKTRWQDSMQSVDTNISLFWLVRVHRAHFIANNRAAKSAKPKQILCVLLNLSKRTHQPVLIRTACIQGYCSSSSIITCSLSRDMYFFWLRVIFLRARERPWSGLFWSFPAPPPCVLARASHALGL